MENVSQSEDSLRTVANEAESSTDAVAQPVIFRPRAYLTQYYEGGVDPGNRALLRFYAKVYEDLGGRTLLEFGGGPTIYSLITAARTASWIHFCDYNDECLSEIYQWLREDSSAFDWSHFTRYALGCEAGGRDKTSSEEDIQARHRLIRQRIRKISHCDICVDDPLLGSSMGPYGAVAQTFCLDCLDSVILDKREWVHLHQKLANLVDKNGLFITVSLLNASHWTVQSTNHAALTLTPADVTSMYEELGFSITHLDVIDDLENKIGYDGFIMACGQRQS